MTNVVGIGVKSNPRLLHCERKSPPIASNADKGLGASDLNVCSSACSNLDGLAKIVAAWPSLPGPIRRAMLVLIG